MVPRCGGEDSVICNRHRAIASHTEYGVPFCLACFREAVHKAEDVLMEQKIAAMRYTSVDALIRRLGGR